MELSENQQQQQEEELEALESIFMDDLQDAEDSVPSSWKPSGKVYRITLDPQLEEEVPEEYALQAEIVFAHTPSYPDEPPLVKARGLRGMTDDDVAALQAAVDEQVEANMGMPMIYALITTAQEWMNERGAALAVPVSDPETERKRAEAAEEARIAALRAHGTAVTPETFVAWQARFEVEAAMAKAGLSDAASALAAAAGKPKVTGKQWFLQQEAQHLDVEPELEEGESEEEEDHDGASAGSWDGNEGGTERRVGDEHLGSSLSGEDDDDDDDDELLNSYLAKSKGETS